MSQARTTAEVRQAIAARVAGMTAPTGLTWTQSPYLYDLFARDNAGVADGAFAVGIPSSTLEGGPGGVRNQSFGWVTSEVHVKFTIAVAPKDQNTSFDMLLDAEVALIKRIHTQDASWPADFRIAWVGPAQRGITTPSGEWLVSDVPFLVQFHTLALV